MSMNDQNADEAEAKAIAETKGIEPTIAQQRKRHRLTIFAVAFVIVGFITVLAIGLKLDPNKIPAALLCKSAHNFQAKLFQGEDYLPDGALASEHVVELNRLKGKVVVLNFWASWCVSCRAEALDLEAYWQAHKEKGIVVLGIAVQDQEEDAKTFAASYGKKYILATDHTGRAALEYGVTGVPETYIINEEGIVIKKFTGPVTTQELNDLVENRAQIFSQQCRV